MSSVIKFFTMMALITFAAPAAARDTADENALFSKADLYAAIDAGDHTLVETAFSELQALTAADKVSVNQLRWLYEVFGTNSPEIAGFAEGWLEAHPESPYARTGLAWVLYTTAWHIRGEKRARFIYPEALDVFRELQFDAWQLAHAAYESEPALLPASDAILRLANPTGQTARALEVLDEAMTLRPDPGTLERGLDMTVPGWGGSWEMVEALCDYYAPALDMGEVDPVLHCKVGTALSFYYGEKGDWALKALAETPMPSLDYLRIHYATSDSATRADAAFAHAYLTRDGFFDYENARRFDEHVAWRYGYDFISEAHMRRAKEHAAEALKRDPYNPGLNKIMASWISTYDMKGDMFSSRVVERVPPEEELEYVRRQLAASPYDPELWREYANVLSRVDSKGALLKAEPYKINTIVFSNHNPGHVIGYAQTKAQVIIELDSLEDQPDSAMWQSLSEAEKARAEQDRQKLLDFRHSIDMDTALRCPMLRAYRLHGVICEVSKSASCDLHQTQRAMFELLVEDIETRRVCTGVMAASDVELFYQPVEVDLIESGG